MGAWSRPVATGLTGEGAPPPAVAYLAPGT